MRILPASKQEWFSLLLFPFKVYVIIVPIWFIYSATEVPNVRYGLAGQSSYVLVAYAICIPFFFLAALIQFVARWRRPAVTSIVFALTAVILFMVMLPAVARNFWEK